MIPRVEVQTLAPPETLLAPCEAPERGGDTIGDALEYIPRLRGALRECNADKAAIREWIDERRE